MRFTKVKLPDGNIIIDTGLPQKSIKPVGLNLLVDLIRMLFTAMAHEPNLHNGVVLAMSEGLVDTIFDISKRDEALDSIAQLMKEELGKDGGASLDEKERMRIETRIWKRVALQATSEHMDGAFGISHRLAIGTFGTVPPLDESPLDESPSGELPPDGGIGEEWKEVDATK